MAKSKILVTKETQQVPMDLNDLIDYTNNLLEEVRKTIHRNHSWTGKLQLLEDIDKDINEHKMKV